MTVRNLRGFTAQQFFGPNGVCSKAMADYEYRPQQEKMMEAVEAAIAREDCLLVEAGAGVGKTLAYLVPALQSGRKVIVATGTKTLMEQIRRQDIPFLEEHLGVSFTVAVLKGRGNYVCHARLLQESDMFDALDTYGDRKLLARIKGWARRTETGDIAELTFLQEGHPVLHRIVSSAEACSGRGCPHFGRCFVFKAREAAFRSDLVITNHHLFFSDLALKEESGTKILPDDAVVILDEAHGIENVATEYFGVAVRSAAVAQLASDAQILAARGEPSNTRHLASLAQKITERFFFIAMRLAGPEGRASIPARSLPPHVEMAWYELDLILESLAEEARSVAQSLDIATDIPARAKKAREALALIFESAETNFVRIAEYGNRHASLSALPVEVADKLRESLFGTARPVVLVSATLTVAGDTHFVRSRLGILSGAQEVVLSSPYDFERQVLLYLPDGMPDPNDERFHEAFAEEALRVLQETKGRAFLLFTSHAGLRKTYEYMKERLSWPVFVQGDAPRDEMIRRFKETRHACLFGTHTFWEGVDVMGPALSCVIIDRLPFDPPDDPMLVARCNRIRERGSNPFEEYQLPMAVIRLRQGFGRLVRHRADRGVVAIMDPRIKTRNYGKLFLRSLPPARVCENFEELQVWCRKNL